MYLVHNNPCRLQVRIIILHTTILADFRLGSSYCTQVSLQTSGSDHHNVRYRTILADFRFGSSYCTQKSLHTSGLDHHTVHNNPPPYMGRRLTSWTRRRASLQTSGLYLTCKYTVLVLSSLIAPSWSSDRTSLVSLGCSPVS